MIIIMWLTFTSILVLKIYLASLIWCALHLYYPTPFLPSPPPRPTPLHPTPLPSPITPPTSPHPAPPQAPRQRHVVFASPRLAKPSQPSRYSTNGCLCLMIAPGAIRPSGVRSGGGPHTRHKRVCRKGASTSPKSDRSVEQKACVRETGGGAAHLVEHPGGLVVKAARERAHDRLDLLVVVEARHRPPRSRPGRRSGPGIGAWPSRRGRAGRTMSPPSAGTHRW